MDIAPSDSMNKMATIMEQACLDIAMNNIVCVNTAAMALGSQLLHTIAKPKKQKKKKTAWVKHMLRLRDVHGHCEQLLEDMLMNDLDGYRRYLRMENALFNDILDRIRPTIQRADTNFRFALTAKAKLTTTLRFLATGDSYPSCMANFRVSKSSIVNFIPEVC
jgi:hypothetical protein